MKTKKWLGLSFLGLATIACSYSVLSQNAGLLLNADTGHGEHCVWNHYDAVEATKTSHGSKEFWACCTHPGDFVLEAPVSGTINDMGEFTGDYFDSLTSEDERYVARITNSYLHLDLTKIVDGAAPIVSTENTFSNIGSFTFKYRVNGTLGGWLGLAIASTYESDVYTPHSGSGYFEFSGDRTLISDGQWHIFSGSFDGTASGYLRFVHAMGEFADASIDLDDVYFETNNGSSSVFEDFFDDPVALYLNPECASILEYDTVNSFMRLEVGKFFLAKYSDASLLSSIYSYSGVTGVTATLRLTSGIFTSWSGFGVSTLGENYSGATGQGGSRSGYLSASWTTVDFTFKSAYDGYVNWNMNVDFGFTSASTDTVIDIDAITIHFSNGSSITDEFDGRSLFKTSGRTESNYTHITGEQISNFHIKFENTQHGEVASIYSLKSFTGVTQVSFDMRINGSKEIDPNSGNPKGAWIGFVVGDQGCSVYDGTNAVSRHTIGNYQLDGEWHNYKLTSFENANGYVNLVGAFSELTDGTTIEIDNIAITTDSKTTTERFLNGATHFHVGVGSLIIESEEPVEPDGTDSHVKFEKSEHGETALIYSLESYSNISQISFDLRVVGSKQIDPNSGNPKGAWLGFVVGDQGCSVYDGTDGDTRRTTTSYELDGEWHTYALSFTNATGHVNLVGAFSELTEGTTIEIDNIVITANGNTITESFIGEASVFHLGVGSLVTESEEPVEPVVGTPLTVENGLIAPVSAVTATAGNFHGREAIQFVSTSNGDNYIHINLPLITDANSKTFHFEILFPTGAPKWQSGSGSLGALAIKGSSAGGSVRQYFDTISGATYIVEFDTWCAFDVDISTYTSLERFAIQLPYATGAEIYLSNVYVA